VGTPQIYELVYKDAVANRRSRSRESQCDSMTNKMIMRKGEVDGGILI
jgi:hypothetical protein